MPSTASHRRGREMSTAESCGQSRSRLDVTDTGSAPRLSATVTDSPVARCGDTAADHLALRPAHSRLAPARGGCLRSAISIRYRLRIDFVSASRLTTFSWGNRPISGSHGFAVEKPACSVASHCIGVRQPSRPTPMPGTFFSKGSRTSSGAIGDLQHAEFVAVIERRRAAQGQQQHGGDTRLLAADPARDPRPVVIAEHPVRPCALRQRRLIFGDQAFDRARAPQRRQQREIERHLRAAQDRCRNRRPGD